MKTKIHLGGASVWPPDEPSNDDSMQHECVSVSVHECLSTYRFACAELVGVRLPQQMVSSLVLLSLAIVCLFYVFHWYSVGGGNQLVTIMITVVGAVGWFQVPGAR